MTAPKPELSLVPDPDDFGPDRYDDMVDADNAEREKKRAGDGGGGNDNGDQWFQKLIWGEKLPKSCLHNVVMFLQHHKDWREVIVWDEFSRRVVFAKQPPFHEYKPRLTKSYVRPEPLGEEEDARESSGPAPGDPPRDAGHEITEQDIACIAAWFGREFKMVVSTNIIADALPVVAQVNAVHPIKAFIEPVRWDGVERIGRVGKTDDDPGSPSWLSTYLGAEDCEYTRLVGRWFFIAAIARIYQPGCQVHSMLVLEGEQGFGKSSAIRALFSPWFSNDLPDTTSKDALQQLSGIWGQEIEEMDIVNKGGVNAAKRFISKAVDRYRQPYGRVPMDFPRTCIMVGTTNEAVYLVDTTGNRRFHPVRTGIIDFRRLGDERRQIFAEALLAFRAGETWHPTTPEQIELLKAQQAERLEYDPWLPILRDWVRLSTKHEFTETEAFQRLHIEPDRQGVTEMRRVTKCLRFLGLLRQERFLQGVQDWVWLRPSYTRPPAPPEPSDSPPSTAVDPTTTQQPLPGWADDWND